MLHDTVTDPLRMQPMPLCIHSSEPPMACLVSPRWVEDQGFHDLIVVVVVVMMVAIGF